MKSEHESLYNKYRPRIISDLVGQDHIVLTLTKAFEKKRLYQAYLCHGSRGCGKTTTARILAMGYNCETGPTATPCGQCQACQDILNERCIDIVEIDAASKTSVSDIRELQQSAMTAASQVRVKFYIVDEVHRISAQAQDAFLKTLEEPPAHVVFILCTTEMDKLKDTTISRVIPLEFRRIPPEKIAERLAWIVTQEKFTADHEALLAIAKACEGGMRDAIVKLSSAMCIADTGHIGMDTVNVVVGSTGFEQCSYLADAIVENNAHEVLKIIGKVADSTTNLQPFYMNIMNYFRGLLVMANNVDAAHALDMTEAALKTALTQSKQLGKHRLLESMKLIFGYNRLIDSIKGRMVLETMCLELLGASQPVAQLPVHCAALPAASALTTATPSQQDAWSQIKNELDARVVKVIESCKQQPTYHHDTGLNVYAAGLSPIEITFIDKAKLKIQQILQERGFKNDIVIHTSNIQTINAKEVFGG